MYQLSKILLVFGVCGVLGQNVKIGSIDMKFLVQGLFFFFCELKFIKVEDLFIIVIVEIGCGGSQGGFGYQRYLRYLLLGSKMIKKQNVIFFINIFRFEINFK